MDICLRESLVPFQNLCSECYRLHPKVPGANTGVTAFVDIPVQCGERVNHHVCVQNVPSPLEKCLHIIYGVIFEVNCGETTATSATISYRVPDIFETDSNEYEIVENFI